MSVVFILLPYIEMLDFPVFFLLLSRSQHLHSHSLHLLSGNVRQQLVRLPIYNLLLCIRTFAICIQFYERVFSSHKFFRAEYNTELDNNFYGGIECSGTAEQILDICSTQTPTQTHVVHRIHANKIALMLRTDCWLFYTVVRSFLRYKT